MIIIIIIIIDDFFIIIIIILIIIDIFTPAAFGNDGEELNDRYFTSLEIFSTFLNFNNALIISTLRAKVRAAIPSVPMIMKTSITLL